MTSLTTTLWACDICGQRAEADGEAMPAGWMSFNGAISRGRGAGFRGEVDLCEACATPLLEAIEAPAKRQPSPIERAS
ncbi:MAG TPA: hypothetical protein PLJ34_05465 [Hyphomicrobiales bacterium]|nr:hypothetical protein [Hyphomicrobiales bacterium]